MAFCKKEGLPVQGAKIEISNRIEVYLKSGKIISTIRKPKVTSNFDWANAILTKETIITDNYKNNENVRAFFSKELGRNFKFNIHFMKWMKENAGKTLGDAILAWKEIEIKRKNKNIKKEIAPQFEYNNYVRDFLADNPNLTKADAIRCWNIKRQMRGDNVYRKSDLKLE